VSAHRGRTLPAQDMRPIWRTKRGEVRAASRWVIHSSSPIQGGPELPFGAQKSKDRGLSGLLPGWLGFIGCAESRKKRKRRCPHSMGSLVFFVHLQG